MFKSIQKCPIIISYIEFFAPSFFHIFGAFRTVQSPLPKLRKKWILQLENYSNMRLFWVFFNHCEYLWILSTDRRMCSWHPRLTRRRSAATPKKVSVAGGTCFRVVIKHQANLKSLEPSLYNYVIMLMLEAAKRIFSRNYQKGQPLPFYPIHTIINNQFQKKVSRRVINYSMGLVKMAESQSKCLSQLFC